MQKIPDGFQYPFFYSNNEAVPKDSNGDRTINQDVLERSTLPKNIFSKFFGIPFGLDNICFHNINSTWTYLNYKTDVDINTTFEFNGKNISVPPTQTDCEPIFANEKFSLLKLHGVSTYSVDYIVKSLSVNEKFQQFLDEKHLNMTDVKKQDLVPIVYSEIYVEVNSITYPVTFLLIFIAWSGFAFLCREIRNFIK